jgi:hypothetical protein
MALTRSYSTTSVIGHCCQLNPLQNKLDGGTNRRRLRALDAARRVEEVAVDLKVAAEREAAEN